MDAFNTNTSGVLPGGNSGGGGAVNSVTGTLVTGTPTNPIVSLFVDGTTIIGAGTVGSPLTLGITSTYGEVPAGLINGINNIFTLSGTPNPGSSLELHLNGALLKQGLDYTLVGSTIDFSISTPPLPGAILLASYNTFGGLPLYTASNGVVLVGSTDFQVSTITNGQYAPLFTAGSVPFSDGVNLDENNSKFFWDDVNFRLGIGTNTPATELDVVGTIKMVNGTEAVGRVLTTLAGDGVASRAPPVTISSPKESVDLASTVALVFPFTGEQVVDGTLTSSSRVLMKDQASQVENGIWDTQAGLWTRALDYDQAGEADAGTFMAVINGAANANTIWMQINTPATPGVNPLVFTQISSVATLYSATNGVQLVANSFEALFLANDGLRLSGANLTVDYDNTSIGIVANNLAVLANGITQAMYAPLFPVNRVPYSDGTNLISSANLTFNGSVLALTGTQTVSSLTGVGTRMVTASATGLLGVQALPIGGGNFADDEALVGTLNGVNTVFTTIANKVPSPAGSLILSRNGAIQKSGGVDFTLAGFTITFVTAPASTDVLIARYRY